MKPSIQGNCRLFLVLAIAYSMASTRAAAEDANDVPVTILIEGRVWTGDVHRPYAEAVAIRDDKIVAVGSRDELQKYRGDKTQVIDAGDGLVVPGLYRFAHPPDRRRPAARFGAAARRQLARRVRPPHRRVRQEAEARRVDHRRRLGPHAVGRRAAVARLDRCGDARQPRVDQSARRPHVAGEHGGDAGRQSRRRCEGCGGRRNRARQGRPADRHVQRQRDVARSIARSPTPRCSSGSMRRWPRWIIWPRAA